MLVWSAQKSLFLGFLFKFEGCLVWSVQKGLFVGFLFKFEVCLEVPC